MPVRKNAKQRKPRTSKAKAPRKTGHPVGRPTVYKKEFAAQAAKLCELGATDGEMADFFGVSVRTFHRWKLDHPDFCHSIKSAKEIADERVERSLYQKATGYDYSEEQAIKLKLEQHKEKVEVVEVRKHSPADTTAAIFWLKNRRSGDWRDKHEIDHTGKMEINGDVDPRQLSRAILAVLGEATIEDAPEE